jgi:hypothetical protein
MLGIFLGKVVCDLLLEFCIISKELKQQWINRRNKLYQSLVGSVVIGVKLSREDRSSIPATAIGRRLDHLMSELTPE